MAAVRRFKNATDLMGPVSRQVDFRPAQRTSDEQWQKTWVQSLDPDRRLATRSEKCRKILLPFIRFWQLICARRNDLFLLGMAGRLVDELASRIFPVCSVCWPKNDLPANWATIPPIRLPSAPRGISRHRA